MAGLTYAMNRLSETKTTVSRPRKSFNLKWVFLVILLGLFGLRNKNVLSSQSESLAARPPKSSKLSVATIRIPNILQYNLPPSTSMVVLNIGSNIDPILPRVENGPCAHSIAFEPMVPDQIPSHPQLTVIPTAVSNSSGSVTMHMYNSHGVSSSIYQADKKFGWAKGEHSGGSRIVPLVSLQQVIAAVPLHIPIRLIMTDIQGHDFTAISSAIITITSRQIPYLRTEVSLDGTFAYPGAMNDLCRDWIPFMEQHGYVFEGLFPPRTKAGWTTVEEILNSCQQQRLDRLDPRAALKELDALWRLASAPMNPQVAYQYPAHSPNPKRPNSYLKIPTFSDDEYATCSKPNNVE
jgi:FkbM family methyltransferase